jgi:hypothetical protein
MAEAPEFCVRFYAARAGAIALRLRGGYRRNRCRSSTFKKSDPGKIFPVSCIGLRHMNASVCTWVDKGEGDSEGEATAGRQAVRSAA